MGVVYYGFGCILVFQILGKAEFLNPGGSVKDRVAVKIIEEVGFWLDLCCLKEKIEILASNFMFYSLLPVHKNKDVRNTKIFAGPSIFFNNSLDIGISIDIRIQLMTCLYANVSTLCFTFCTMYWIIILFHLFLLSVLRFPHFMQYI